MQARRQGGRSDQRCRLTAECYRPVPKVSHPDEAGSNTAAPTPGTAQPHQAATNAYRPAGYHSGLLASLLSFFLGGLTNDTEFRSVFADADHKRISGTVTGVIHSSR